MAKADKTDIIKKKFIEMLASQKAAGNVLAACTATGFSRTTMYEWRSLDEQFAKDWDQAVLDGREHLAEEAEVGLRINIQKGNIVAQIFALKNLRGGIWREKTEIGGKDGKPIEVSMPGTERWLKNKMAEEMKKK